MKRYEIINPSDPIFLSSDDFEAACIAVCLIGGGRYALEEVGGDGAMPLFLFGGTDGWFQEQFGVTAQESHDRLGSERIAQVLEAVQLKEGHERSSLNDICGRAQEYAGLYRAAADAAQAAAI